MQFFAEKYEIYSKTSLKLQNSIILHISTNFWNTNNDLRDRVFRGLVVDVMPYSRLLPEASTVTVAAI